MNGWQLTPEAVEDLFDIWAYVARDNPDAANHVEQAIYLACDLLAESPLAGRTRGDLTPLPLRFWLVLPTKITSSLTIQTKSHFASCASYMLLVIFRLSCARAKRRLRHKKRENIF